MAIGAAQRNQPRARFYDACMQGQDEEAHSKERDKREPLIPERGPKP
jgi:hypothetical protein